MNRIQKTIKKNNFARDLFYVFYFIMYIVALLLIFYRNVNQVAFPRNSFLNDWVTRFGDFYVMFDEWNRLGFGGVGFGLSYFPGAYFIPEFLGVITLSPYDAIKVLMIISLATIFISLRKICQKYKIKPRFVYLIFFTSYPVLIGITTGNIEIFVFALVSYFFYQVINKRLVVAALVLGIASAPKLVTLSFLLIFLAIEVAPRRKLKLIAISILTSLTLNALALLLLPNGVLQKGIASLSDTYRGFRESVQLYEDLMIWSGSGIHFGHSPLGAVRGLGLLYIENGSRAVLLSFFCFAAFNLAITLYLIYKKANLELTGLSGSILLSLTLPTSTDYRLLYFAFFLTIFIALKAQKRNEIVRDGVRVLEFAISLLGLLVLAPKPWGYIGISDYVNASVWLTPILLIMIQSILVIYAKSGMKPGEISKSRKTSKQH